MKRLKLSCFPALLVSFATLLAPAGALAQEPKMILDEVLVGQAPQGVLKEVGPDTLCSLRVKIHNRGEEKASSFGFEVKINGKAVPVYERRLYMVAVAPGETRQLSLYNFWSTEKGRPAPEDGKLTVEVTLKEARWVEIKKEDNVQVWRPLGEVEGLPSSQAVTLSFRKS